MSEEVSVKAAGRGAPYINLSDGRELLTDYSGPQEPVSTLESKQAEGRSLASADFDEDGVPDLISGYAAANGGIVTLLRGNLDVIYPNVSEAKQRKAEGTFTDAPFLSPAFVFSVPEAVDFVGAGDFDGDSHWDVVAARRGGKNLYLLSGDGKGGLMQPKQIGLSGKVTALVVGEINRRDGLDDVVVGVRSEAGAKVLVYEGPEGALQAKPEVFSVAEEVTSLVLGQLDDSYEMDLAVAAGHQLMLVYGRDRRLSLDQERQREVKAAHVEQRQFSFLIRSIVAGDFTGNHRTDIAMLRADGRLIILSAGEARSASQQAGGQSNNIDIEKWQSEDVASNSVWSEGAGLVCARVSSAPVDNLVVVDRAGHKVEVIAKNKDGVAGGSAGGGATARLLRAKLESTDEPEAVLPMRLNSDALGDLVMLKNQSSLVSVVSTQAVQTFTVTNTNDSGFGSLRQAILDANANPGADTITFDIAGAGVPTIRPFTTAPFSLLPIITEAVTIDGTTQPAGHVEMDGTLAGPGFLSEGLFISARSVVVRGLVINRFAGSGIAIRGGGNNIVEGNLIGTDVTGTVRLSNAGGVLIGGGSASTNSIIGGTVAAARNIISGNQVDGIQITDLESSGNQIKGNYIGTDSTGTLGLGNHDGVGILSGNSNQLGGTMAGSGNVISGNDVEGIILASIGNLVQGNYIGTDKTGATALGNSSTGVIVFTGAIPGSHNTIGGTIIAARNIISSNRSGGIDIVSKPAIENLVQGNLIGLDAAGVIPLGNFSGVRITDAPQTTIGGVVPGAGNVISGNTTHGIAIGLYDPKTQLFGDTEAVVQGNYIGTNISGTGGLGNLGDGIFIENNSISNMVGGTAPEAANVIAFNQGNGIRIPDDPSSPSVPKNAAVQIRLFTNLIYSNGLLGIDLGPSGITLNDDQDPDRGANELQNYPVLTSSTPSIVNRIIKGAARLATSISVTGIFNSTPNQTFTLQFFLGTQRDATGHQLFGSIPIMLTPDLTVTTDGNGNAPFTYTFELPSGYSGGWVNATATSADGNTSEQTECIPVANANLLVITKVEKSGKNFIVSGAGFVNGAKLLVNGIEKRTRVDSAASILSKKGAKAITYPAHIQVRAADNSLSNEYIFNLP